MLPGQAWVADLDGADLSGADLSGANLAGADLAGADLAGADLDGANLSRADLSGADLSGADLSGADLSGADLDGANLDGADLDGANLDGKKIKKLKSFVGLYKYRVDIALGVDGERYIKMGCLFYSLSDWERIGILQSNVREFPDDGSEKSLERQAAFEFAKSAALRLFA